MLWWSKKPTDTPRRAPRQFDAAGSSRDAGNDRIGYPQCGPPTDPEMPAALRGSPLELSRKNQGSVAQEASPHCGAESDPSPPPPAGKSRLS
jgi:hypothetical protein